MLLDPEGGGGVLLLKTYGTYPSWPITGDIPLQDCQSFSDWTVSKPFGWTVAIWL